MNKNQVVAEYLLNKAYLQIDNLNFSRMIDLCGKMEELLRSYNPDKDFMKEASYLMSVLKESDRRSSDAQFNIHEAMDKLRLDFTYFDECEDECLEETNE